MCFIDILWSFLQSESLWPRMTSGSLFLPIIFAELSSPLFIISCMCMCAHVCVHACASLQCLHPAGCQVWLWLSCNGTGVQGLQWQTSPYMEGEHCPVSQVNDMHTTHPRALVHWCSMAPQRALAHNSFACYLLATHNFATYVPPSKAVCGRSVRVSLASIAVLRFFTNIEAVQRSTCHCDY